MKMPACLIAVLALAVPARPARAEEAPRQKIVVFAERTAPGERIGVLAGLGLPAVRELPLIDAVVVRVPRAELAAFETRLKGLPQVLRVDDDPYVAWLGQTEAPKLPSVDAVIEGLKSKHGLPRPPLPPVAVTRIDPEVPWGIARVNAPAAWKAGRGAGVKVAVVDTGIDAAHPDLAANVAGGFNAMVATASWADDHGHGTHVAGTIAAVHNSTGVVGVAPEARLYGVKVLDKNGSGYYSTIIAGIGWAVENKMQVLNMSLGGPNDNQSMHDAVKRAVEAGVTVVCAAGNSGGSVSYPGAYPESIAVSASNNFDKITTWSSRGPQVAFIAPGSLVLSTFKGGGYRFLSGTSMASPHVAGLAALKLGQAGNLAPAALREALKAAASPLSGMTPDEQGAGMIDAAKLLGVRSR